jgi:hypothetical protein
MRRINAESLIELAVNTLQTEIRPAIAPEARYALAMTVAALETARRELLSDSDAAQWTLLDYVYDDGEGTLDQLTKDITSGTVSDATHAELRQRLEHLLVAELEVRNPRALKGRVATGG